MKPSTVAQYLRTLPAATRLVIERVMQTIRDTVPEAKQSLSYGIPAFSLEDRPLLYVAGWKAHWSIYPATEHAIAQVRALAPYKASKGTLKIAFDAEVPLALIQKLALARVAELAAEAETKARVVKPRPRRKRPQRR